jgi:hypothetical protein
VLLILSRCSVPDNGPTPTSDLGGPLPWAPGSPGPGYARLPLARGVVCPDNLPLHRTDRGAWDRRRKTCRLSQALSPDRLSVPCPLIYACHHHDIYCPTYAPLPYYYYPRGGVAWVVGVGPAKDLDGSGCATSKDTRLVEGTELAKDTRSPVDSRIRLCSIGNGLRATMAGTGPHLPTFVSGNH